MHLALALLRVGKTPLEDVGPVAVAAVVGVGFGQVDFADAADAVAAIAQALVVSGPVGRQETLVAQRPQAPGLQAGGQGDARRGADRGVGGALGKAHPLARQAIEVGGLDKGSAGRA